jgi:uncharacterized protein YdaU (DUF1376 family)
MAPEKSPTFQFWPKDFLTDGEQAALSLEQCGAYIRLLCTCWLEHTIPDDATRLARIVGGGITSRRMEVIWPDIRSCFISDPQVPGRLRHSRLDRERLVQAEWREKSAEGGRKSQANRKGSSKGGSTTVPTIVQPRTDSPVSSLQSPSTPKPPEGAGEHPWNQWREAWERSGRTSLPANPKAIDIPKLGEWSAQYPDPAWRALQLRAFFEAENPEVRKSPPSLGWFLVWVPEIDLLLRKSGRRPKTEAA